jgi:hypothetical protein
MAGLHIELSAQKYPLNCLENGKIGTLLFMSLYYPEEMFMPQTDLFSGFNLPVGLMAGLHSKL